MKKTIIALMALTGVSQVMAASISSDDYIYSGSGVSIPLDEDILPSTGSFAISYELVGLTLNDVIGVAGQTFFEIEIGGQSLELIPGPGFFASNGIGGMMYYVGPDVPPFPNIEFPVTLVFQYDSDDKCFTASYYMEYVAGNYDLNKFISVDLGGNDVFEGFSSGSFTITLPSGGEAAEIHTWIGIVEADDIAALRKESLPEPTTATLSLLALAGLAARRRRK